MHTKIKDLLISAQSGSYRTVCPVCNGGSSKEKSLVVCRDGRSVKWICHRASCTERGRAVVNSNTLVAETREESLDVHTRAVKIPHNYTARIVRDNEGKEQGRVWRRDECLPKSFAKDINDINKDWCMLHFPMPINSSSVIVVEDIISANMMCPFYPCVALLGVHLNAKKLEYLLQQGVKHVIVALDNDATRAAIRITRQWMVSTSVLPLARDLKDESDEKLKQIAEELKENDE